VGELNRLYLFVRSPQARQIWRRSPSEFFFQEINQFRFISTHINARSSTTTAGGSFKPDNFWSVPTNHAHFDVRYQTLPERGVPTIVSPDNALESGRCCARAARGNAYKTIYGADVHPRLVGIFMLSDNFRARCVLRDELNRAVRRVSGVPRTFLQRAEKNDRTDFSPNSNSARLTKF